MKDEKHSIKILISHYQKSSIKNIEKSKNKMAEVYLNSKFAGNVDNPIEFVQKIREERRKGIVTENLNVYYNEKADEIQLESSKGRARRPLIIVKDGVPLLTERHIKQLEKNEISWSDLVKQGIIEYLDVAEEENALVAFFESELASEAPILEIKPEIKVELIEPKVEQN